MAVLALREVQIGPDYTVKIEQLEKSILNTVKAEYVSGEALTSYNFQTVDSFNQVIKQTVTNLNGAIEEKTKYMRFTNKGLEIGEVSVPIKLVIKNDRIAFVTSDNSEPMWITANMIHINELEVKEKFKFGGMTVTINSQGIGVIR